MVITTYVAVYCRYNYFLAMPITSFIILQTTLRKNTVDIK